MNNKLKLKLLKDRNKFKRLLSTILGELHSIDLNATQRPAAVSLASRNLVKELWGNLPEEHSALKFNDIREQTEKGKNRLPTRNFDEIITVHFGWDILCFECSLGAAWNSWINFCGNSPETFNCCIYPNDLDWFIIRAGTNLYPMKIDDKKYEILTGD